MTPVELTSVIGLVVVAISTILVPAALRRRQTRDRNDRNDVVSWQGLNATLKQDVVNLRSERDADRAEHKARIAELETEYTRQLISARQRISQLETEVATLYRQLYDMQTRPQPPASGAVGG